MHHTTIGDRDDLIERVPLLVTLQRPDINPIVKPRIDRALGVTRGLRTKP
jgi:hypothetical protein